MGRCAIAPGRALCALCGHRRRTSWPWQASLAGGTRGSEEVVACVSFAAETARQARQARLHRPAGMPGARGWSLRWLRSMLRPGRKGVVSGPRAASDGTRAVLRDGSAVLIRPIQPADAPLLADGFARLSLKSRQQRFLTPKQELSPAELRYLTDIDHHEHEALGAVSRADGRGVGIARYVRRAEDPQTAEIAVTVVDDWQGRGLGAELLARLSDRARQEGICRLTALVSACTLQQPADRVILRCDQSGEAADAFLAGPVRQSGQ